MLTNNALRFVGLAGLLGVFACTQACNSPSEEVNVITKQGITPKGGDSRFVPPRPPANYQIKWTTCSKWIEGEAQMENNSRVVKPAADGTITLTLADMTGNDGRPHVRVKADSLPKSLKMGKGIDTTTKRDVLFWKIGQTVMVRNANGTYTNYVVSSENLGNPVRLDNGKLSYLDWCYRNPKTAGKDTLGVVQVGVELSATCVMEDVLADYNALSAEYPFFSPIYNYADKNVGMLNSPDFGMIPHPEAATPVKTVGSINYYQGWSAALNDINGTERDDTLSYLSGERFCHYINNGGFEVPGAKRPGTISNPAPGAPNEKTYIVWRPVNVNVNVANEKEAPAPDPVEPEPATPDPAADAVPESDVSTPF